MNVKCCFHVCVCNHLSDLVVYLPLWVKGAQIFRYVTRICLLSGFSVEDRYNICWKCNNFCNIRHDCHILVYSALSSRQVIISMHHKPICCWHLYCWLCFDFLQNFCPQHFSLQEELSEMWSKMYIGPLVKYPLSLFNFTETWIFWSIGKTLKNQFF